MLYEEKRDYARELLDSTNAMMIADSGTKSTNGYSRYQKYRGMLIRQIRGIDTEEKPMTVWQQAKQRTVDV